MDNQKPADPSAPKTSTEKQQPNPSVRNNEGAENQRHNEEGED